MVARNLTPAPEANLITVVWDRRRFGHLWSREYRFEAYTPVVKRVLGYYAMPLLRPDQVIGFANCAGPGSNVEAGYVDGAPGVRHVREGVRR